jgi:hypothetical protein
MNVVVGKVYLMELEYPTELNNDSPLTGIPLQGQDSVGTSLHPSIRSIQRCIGVVLQWHPHSQIAIILIATARPQVPHRYIPWVGTNRMDFQTREVLEPTPSGAFADQPGFMNFTHALRVRVVTRGKQDALSTPLNIIFDSDQVEKLRRLHEAYWSGVRYNRDGSFHSGDEGDEGDDGDNAQDWDEGGGDGIPEALSRVSVARIHA